MHLRFYLSSVCVWGCVYVCVNDRQRKFKKGEFFCKPNISKYVFYLFMFSSCKDLGLVQINCWTCLLSGSHNDLPLRFAICDWSLKSPLFNSYNCPFGGFAFSPSLSSFREMSVFFFLSLALWEFLEINKQFGEGNSLWERRAWVSAMPGGRVWRQWTFGF